MEVDVLKDIKLQVDDNSKSIQLILQRLNLILHCVEGQGEKAGRPTVFAPRHRSSSESLYRRSPRDIQRDIQRHRLYNEGDQSTSKVHSCQLSPHHEQSPTKNTELTDEEDGVQGSEGYLTDEQTSERGDSLMMRGSHESLTACDTDSDRDKGPEKVSENVGQEASPLEGTLKTSVSVPSSSLRDASASSVSTTIGSVSAPSLPLTVPNAPPKAKKTPLKEAPISRSRKVSGSESRTKTVKNLAIPSVSPATSPSSDNTLLYAPRGEPYMSKSEDDSQVRQRIVKPTNKAELERELTDLLAVINFTAKQLDSEYRNEPIEKTSKYWRARALASEKLNKNLIDRVTESVEGCLAAIGVETEQEKSTSILLSNTAKKRSPPSVPKKNRSLRPTQKQSPEMDTKFRSEDDNSEASDAQRSFSASDNRGYFNDRSTRDPPSEVMPSPSNRPRAVKTSSEMVPHSHRWSHFFQPGLVNSVYEATIVGTQMALSSSVLVGGCEGYFIEPEVEEFNPVYHMQCIRNAYKEFANEKHSNFIVTEKGSNKFFILSVMEKDEEGYHKALENSQNGFMEYEIPRSSLKKKGISSFIPNLYPTCTMFQIREPAAINEILMIEKKYRQNVKIMKIALLYCQQGQSDPMKMFDNDKAGESAEYKTFSELMGVPPLWKPDNPINVSWSAKNIIWYPSTLLDDEDQRQYIANTSCIVIYKDGGEPFDISEIHKMGKLSLVFIVVMRATELPGYYRVALFHKDGVKVFQPMVPVNWLFPASGLKDFILTKLYNACMMLRTVPPLNVMYTRPRHMAIREIAEKYATKHWLKSVNFDPTKG